MGCEATPNRWSCSCIAASYLVSDYDKFALLELCHNNNKDQRL